MPNKYIQNNYCILLGIFSPPLIASEWAEMLHRLCIWLAQNTLKAMSVSSGPELLCEEQEAAGQNRMEPHAHNIIWADKQQEMIPKQERLHKTIRIICWEEEIHRYHNSSRAPESSRNCSLCTTVKWEASNLPKSFIPFQIIFSLICQFASERAKYWWVHLKSHLKKFMGSIKKKKGKNSAIHSTKKYYMKPRNWAQVDVKKCCYALSGNRNTPRNQEQISIKILSRFCIKNWDSHAQCVFWK